MGALRCRGADCRTCGRGLLRAAVLPRSRLDPVEVRGVERRLFDAVVVPRDEGANVVVRCELLFKSSDALTRRRSWSARALAPLDRKVMLTLSDDPELLRPAGLPRSLFLV